MSTSLETLAPGLLIASPSLKDPNFDHTVILMCMHNDQGAMGLVVNRPAPITTYEIFRQLGMPSNGADQSAMTGGPVAVESALLLYEADQASEERDDEIAVFEQLRLCPGQHVLEAIARGDGPARFHIFLGHSGWGPGQLERELALGAWIPASVHVDLLWDAPVDDRWQRALQAEGLNPGAISTFRPRN